MAARAQGANCEELRQAIALKFKAGGGGLPNLVIVGSSDVHSGRIVGSCAFGTKRIVQLADGNPRKPTVPTAPKTPADAILTECRDGTVSLGGTCGRR